MKGFVGESQSLALPLPVGKALTYSAMFTTFRVNTLSGKFVEDTGDDAEMRIIHTFLY